jgi:hypothetical protein
VQANETGDDDEPDAGWNFQEMFERVQSYDISVLFSVWVGEDDKNSSKNILQVSETFARYNTQAASFGENFTFSRRPWANSAINHSFILHVF